MFTYNPTENQIALLNYAADHGVNAIASADTDEVMVFSVGINTLTGEESVETDIVSNMTAMRRVLGY